MIGGRRSPVGTPSVPATDGAGRPQVVFIAGLGHSGSTLLSLLLNGHPRTLGVGEVLSYLRRSPVERARRGPEACSCGAALPACPLWGPIVDVVEDPSRPIADRYRAVLDQARSVHGEDVTLIDSSKNIEALEVVAEVTEDVRVAFLVRDVRSWTIANLDRSTRWQERTLRQLVRSKGSRGPAYRLSLTPWGRFRVWERYNDRFAAELPGFGFPVVTVGYEPLATSPRWVLERLCPQLGLDLSEEMLVPAARVSHQVGGNRMHASRDKTREVMYSTRWLTRSEWMLPALLRPGTMRRNRAWVYDSTGPAPVDRYATPSATDPPPRSS